MPTPEDFKTARALALETLKKSDLEACCQKAGVSLEKMEEGKERISIPFMGKARDLVVTSDETSFDESAQPIKLQDQVLLLHYLITATGMPIQNKWITFREVPSGPFYYPSFVKRAITPFVKCFGENPEGLEKVGAKIGELLSEPGDVAVKVLAFPKVPVVLSLWKGDEEFPPEGNVLFDASITSYLSTEDIAYVAGAVVYPAIGMFRSMAAS
jgi:hypothetical protein